MEIQTPEISFTQDGVRIASSLSPNSCWKSASLCGGNGGNGKTASCGNFRV